MSSSTLVIRPLEQKDRPLWEPHWAGYQAFYKVSIAPAVTDETWRRLLDPKEPMHVLGAFDGPTLLGIVHYIFHRSTWTTGDYCYLQDLFVDPTRRGGGTGRKLIEAVYDASKAKGASRVYWLTAEDNAPARLLYDKVASYVGFIQYRKQM